MPGDPDTPEQLTLKDQTVKTFSPSDGVPNGDASGEQKNSASRGLQIRSIAIIQENVDLPKKTVGESNAAVQMRTPSRPYAIVVQFDRSVHTLTLC